MKYLNYKDLFIVPALKTDDFSQRTIYTGMLSVLRHNLKRSVWVAKDCKHRMSVQMAFRGFTEAVSVYNIWALNSNAPYMQYTHILEIEKMIIELCKREVKDHE